MLLSGLSPSAALAPSFLSSDTSLASALPSSSISTISAPNQSCKRLSKDELVCQVAHDYPMNFLHSTDPPIEAIGLLNNGTIPKNFLSSKAPTGSKSGVDCVQCIEVLQTDIMNHCVPEWDATGRDMDVIWGQTELFSLGKAGQTRRSDFGFVPEHDFEELCWEDGQLLVVMQGLSSKGNPKNRSCWQVSSGEMALPTTGMDSTLVLSGAGELMDPSTVNMHNQEDELLSWLQHPPEELVEKLDLASDMPSSNTPLVDCEAMCRSNLTSHGSLHNLGNAEDFDEEDNNSGDTNHKIQVNTSTRSSSIPNTVITSKDPSEPSIATSRVEMPPPVMAPMTMGTSLTNGSKNPMNFSNFAKPAVSFKANLHSLGMTSGPSGTERLKQLDRVTVDVSRPESTGATKHLRQIVSRRDGSTPALVPKYSACAGAINASHPTQIFPLQRESELEITATGIVNGFSGTGGISDGWNSSLISNTALGMGAEQSDTSSSGGSEDSERVDGKTRADMVKRKRCDEYSEIQSKALENEATISMKHATGGESLKRSRAAENHNQSERRRRDRISEKMKTLQALVPNSYKTDKASMLEEAIVYIKALKGQIQMMSYRSGMYFSPMIMPQGMQHLQMAAWPNMGMGMGMNMGMGMGMLDMSIATAAATPRQFSPVLPFPGGVIPSIHSTASAALDSARPVHMPAHQVVPHSAHQVMMPIGQGNVIVGTWNTSPTINVPCSQQQQPVQSTNPQVVAMGRYGNSVPYPRQCRQSTTFMGGSQKK